MAIEEGFKITRAMNDMDNPNDIFIWQKKIEDNMF